MASDILWLGSFQRKRENAMRTKAFILGGVIMGWIPVSDLQDDSKIWAGNRVRIFNVGLNVINKSEDYFEYIVSFIYGDNQFLQLTCLSQGEGGNTVCVLKKDLPNHYATGRELKSKIGIENTFVNLEYT